MSSQFEMTITVDNPAFHDTDTGKLNVGPELARILHAVADDVENGDIAGTVRDVDGNVVGQYGILSDD